MQMSSIWTLHLHSLSFQHRISSNILDLRTELGFRYGCYLKSNSPKRKIFPGVYCCASISNNADGDGKTTASSGQYPFDQFQQTITSLPPVVFLMRRHSTANYTIGICIATAFLVIAVKAYVLRKSRDSRPGSVADLVRRGQLRSDRRGISQPLKYEDPFNNPLVKVKNGNSTVEMCGKVYKLAPVTLTEEQQAIHQKRRSRAYQWKRPKVFLKEGDSIPPDVDPDTVRWIPANHPFATTASDIDENLAQNNVYQKHGVPFRIQAEHEALQKKLEALQIEQKLNKLMIDPSNAKDFERPFRSQPKFHEQVEQSPNNQVGNSRSSRLEHDRASSPLGSNSSPSSPASSLSPEKLQEP
ncbi:hypothetical protein RJ641_028722 [Dillenia turbinata]|uniref:Protein MULTIPLE CHLOROPLAST DIVISION SITE 1 n=1 Tax=Dillenia turbinata TaxID=194707 RepID=A0AAN8W0I8_9MAGN